MTKLQQLKEKIYCSKHGLSYTPENVKKAMELELGLFGCEVIDDRDDEKKKISHPCWGLLEGNYAFAGTDDICNKDNVKILGTPITGLDILKVLDPKTPIELWVDGTLLIGDIDEAHCFFDLTKTLDNQSPETIDFLSDLLTP